MVTKSISVEFYGVHLLFDVPIVFTQKLETFSTLEDDYYKKVTRTEISTFLTQVKNAQSTYRINDRFLFILLSRISVQVAPDENYQNVMLWCLAKKLGYTVAMGSLDGYFHFLPCYKEHIEELKYYEKPEGLFYIDPLISDYFKGGPIHINQVKGEKTAMYLPAEFPKVPVLVNYRLLNFYFRDVQYEINLRYDYTRVSFYSKVPGFTVGTYLNTAMSKTLTESLHEQLDPIIKNWNKEDGVAFILTMIQSAFPYRTDGEQMGGEKYFFPDEFLHYNFSDCEDRSIFFKKAVEELLHVETRLLSMPNHVAAAVYLDSVTGQPKITLGGKLFYYCETTAVGFNIGDIPPGKKDQIKGEWN